jgi:hypothetical protein
MLDVSTPRAAGVEIEREGIITFEAPAPAGDPRLVATYLPRRPSLRRNERGDPVFALTLVLARDPAPDEAALESLITQGFASCELTLAVDPAHVLAAGDAPPPRPVFARPASFQLIDRESGATVAAVDASGPNATASLSWQAGADGARRVLRALRRETSGYVIVVDVHHAVAEPPRRILVSGSWAGFWDALAAVAGDEPWIDTRGIERALVTSIERGALLVQVGARHVGTQELQGDLLQAVFQVVMRAASIVLERSAGMGEGRWRLRSRPDPRVGLSFSEFRGGSRLVVTRLEAALETVIGGSLDDRDWSQHVRLVSPSGQSQQVTFRPTPRRERAVVERAERADGDRPLAMTALAGTMMSTAAVVSPAQPAVRPVGLQSAALHHIDLGLLAADVDPGSRPLSLPVFSDPPPPLLPDRVTTGKFWYLPVLEPVPPEAGIEPEQSPFLFRVERVGTTQTGAAALSATIRITLRAAMPATVRDAMAKQRVAALQPVPMQGLDVTLTLPFIDSESGQPQRHQLRGEVTVSGDTVVATFAVASDWVRLAYGALSEPGAPTSAAPQVAFAYRYDCYRAIRDWPVFVCGTKEALLPVHWSKDPAPDLPLVLEASRGLLKAGNLRMRLEAETDGAAGPAPGRPPEGLPRETRLASGADGADRVDRAGAASTMAGAAVLTAASARPVLARPAKPVAAELALRPGIHDAIFLPPKERVFYVRESRAVSAGIDFLVPCNAFGSLYQQRYPEGWRAIGCEPAMRLGEISYHLYEDLPELGGSWFTVRRSLAQPGRFLVVPRTYRITRYAPGHARAFRPCAMIYAALDSERPEASRYTFVATVEPDIPPFAWRDLRARLGSYAPGSVVALDLPTDVANAVELPSVTLAGGIDPPRIAPLGNGIQVTLQCGLSDALVLRTALERSGVAGTLTFTLLDDTHVQSAVDLHLASIAGPWQHGPVAIEALPTALRLRNHIDRALDVTELRLYRTPSAYEAVRCERRIAPEETWETPVENPVEDAVATFTIVPQGTVTIEEARLFVEDVLFNVVFSCGVNFETRGIADLEVSARLQGDSTPLRVALQPTTPRVGEARLVAPISRVVESGSPWGIAEYRAVRVMTSGARVETPWRTCSGAHIDLTWELLQP